MVVQFIKGVLEGYKLPAMAVTFSISNAYVMSVNSYRSNFHITIC